jgi:acyl-CoA thioesterase I
MSETCPSLTRRTIVAAVLALPSAAAAAPAKICTILGDSITAGYGLPAAAALPVQLQAALRKMGQRIVVRGAGVSGDTTAGALARVGFSVQQDSQVCVVALGGNDVLQGLRPAATRANLRKIIDKLRARRIRVVLAGLAPPPQLGGAYVQEFAAIFPDLGKQPGVILYPNLLDGVMLNARLNQSDGIHPNAEGVKIIAAKLAPVVVRAFA